MRLIRRSTPFISFLGPRGGDDRICHDDWQRQIRAIITDHVTADRLHQEAQQQGLVTSLMEQDSNGLVNVRIANLEPGSSVDVEFTYFSETPFRDGGYEFVFPQFAAVRSRTVANPDSERFRFSLDVQTPDDSTLSNAAATLPESSGVGSTSAG